jgi:hypothetical protein
MQVLAQDYAAAFNQTGLCRKRIEIPELFVLKLSGNTLAATLGFGHDNDSAMATCPAPVLDMAMCEQIVVVSW